MIPPDAPTPDPRLDVLFVRYWDDALTNAEAAELERRLSSNPADRDWFRFLTLQAVTAAEFSAVVGASANIRPPAPDLKKGRWSRRRVLRFLGTGLAATVAASFVVRQFIAERAGRVKLTAHGNVNVRTSQGVAVPSGGSVPTDGTVSTHGLNSWAMLSYSDGTSVSLAGDTVLTVVNDGRRLLLGQGNATADVRRPPAGEAPLVLATAMATLTDLNGAITTLGHTPKGTTEVGVLQGRVTVDAPSGEPLAVVCEGEMLTVKANGSRHKQSLPTTPDEFAWDLTRPLPESWHMGTREVTPDGPVIRPRFWFDPYHQAQMSQIRSDQQWARGFFRLFPESEFRVRYWVERPGPSQLCVCVRTAQTRASETGMIECNTAFVAARPREWQWLTVSAREMLDNIHAPGFGPPWVGFLVIVNTYKEDIGLKVSEFRVTRPGGGAASI